MPARPCARRGYGLNPGWCFGLPAQPALPLSCPVWVTQPNQLRACPCLRVCVRACASVRTQGLRFESWLVLGYQPNQLRACPCLRVCVRACASVRTQGLRFESWAGFGLPALPALLPLVGVAGAGTARCAGAASGHLAGGRGMLCVYSFPVLGMPVPPRASLALMRGLLKGKEFYQLSGIGFLQ